MQNSFIITIAPPFANTLQDNYGLLPKRECYDLPESVFRPWKRFQDSNLNSFDSQVATYELGIRLATQQILPMYVGATKNLGIRLREHLLEETTIAKSLSQANGLGFELFFRSKFFVDMTPYHAFKLERTLLKTFDYAWNLKDNGLEEGKQRRILDVAKYNEIIAGKLPEKEFVELTPEEKTDVYYERRENDAEYVLQSSCAVSGRMDDIQNGMGDVREQVDANQNWMGETQSRRHLRQNINLHVNFATERPRIMYNEPGDIYDEPSSDDDEFDDRFGEPDEFDEPDEPDDGFCDEFVEEDVLEDFMNGYDSGSD